MSRRECTAASITGRIAEQADQLAETLVERNAEIKRLRDALVALLDAVEDYGLDAAFGDEKFKAVVAAREAVRRAT